MNNLVNTFFHKKQNWYEGRLHFSEINKPFYFSSKTQALQTFFLNGKKNKRLWERKVVAGKGRPRNDNERKQDGIKGKEIKTKERI